MKTINQRIETPRTCEICSAQFFPFRASKGMYCSNACRFESMKVDGTQQCTGCSETFIAKKKGLKYCSNPCYQKTKKKRPLRDRLYEFIEKSDGCWLWTGGLNHNGYGRLYFDGQFVLAHRMAYALETGENITGKTIRHYVCDNPPCCRFDHLRSGTMKQNANDAVSKGRHAHGETTYSKLTESQVLAIIADPQIHRLIAADYGISRRHVGSIKSGSAWKHLPR